MTFGTILAEIRHLPRHILIPVAVLVAVLILTAIGMATSHTPARTGPAATAHSATHAAAITNPALALPRASAAAASSAPSVPSARVAFASTAPMVAPADVLTPPPGARQGFAHRAMQAPDQRGSWITLGTRVVQRAALTVSTPARDPATTEGHPHYVWTAWVRLPARVAAIVMDVAGGQGRVAATIDGQPAGGTKHYSSQGDTRAVTAVTLGAGWHQVTITATPEAGQLRVSLAEADGYTAPHILVPWATPRLHSDSAATPATVASASSAHAPATGAAVKGTQP